MIKLIQWDAHCTWADLLKPAMSIKTQKAADHYFESAVQFGMKRHGKSREASILWMKANLGYYAGYYDSETMARVNRLFNTAHPVFGNEYPTSEQAFAAGVKLAQTIC